MSKKHPCDQVKTYKITMIIAVNQGSAKYIPVSIEDGMEFDRDAGEGILEYSIQKATVPDGTKWYWCPRCDAGYLNQECVCEESEE